MTVKINIFEFTKAFPNEASCIAYLEKSRWQGGNPVSPFGGGGTYRIRRAGLYKCKRTRQTFTVRHGTIFEESRLPLKKWFFAIFLLHSLKNGISSIQLAKYLGVTQKTAWFMLQRIRYAVEHKEFKKPLIRMVETDKIYTGGHTGVRGRGAASKAKVIGILQRGGGTCRKAVSNAKSGTVSPILCETVAASPTAKLISE